MFNGNRFVSSRSVVLKAALSEPLTIFYATVQLYSIYLHINYMCIPKTKKIFCVGREDLTFLFKRCEIDKSQGRLV